MAKQPQTFLITGANRGIGLELATQLASKGHTIIGTARDPDDASELRAIGAQVERLDIMDDASVAGLAQRLENRAAEIDVLINNAAAKPRHGTIEELDPTIFLKDVEIQVVGPMRVIRAALPSLRRGSGKLIVSLSSNLGQHVDAEETGGFHAYRCGKSALNMLKICIARDLSPEGFRCLALHPGWVKTRMGGPDAPLQVHESAGGLADIIERAEEFPSGSLHDYQGNKLEW